MRIALAADHAGFALKQLLAAHLRAHHDVQDLGPADASRVDYPDFAAKVAAVVASGAVDRGVLVCGTGIGISIAANKVDGIRAALCHDDFTARLARAHNDANVICLGSRVVGEGVALSAVEAFLTTPFEGGRHADRVRKLHGLERAGRPE